MDAGACSLRRRAAGRGARPRASTPSASRRPSRSPAPAPTSRSARRPGCTAAWRSPTGNPARSTDPERALPGARALVVGRPPLPAPAPAGAAADRPVGRVAALRLGRPLRRRCGPASSAVADAPAEADGWRARVAGRRQRPGRPRGGPPRRPRLVRQERQPAAARAGQLVRARLGRHRRAAADAAGRAGAPTAAGRAALPRRLPDRAPSSRPGWSTPAAAWPGCCRPTGAFPRRAPRGARRPHLRLRRLPGGVPAQPAGDAAGAGRRRPTARRLGAGARPAGRRRRRAARPPRPLVHPRRDPATCGATPSSCSATSATAHDPRSSPPAPGYLATPTRSCGRTPCGRPAASAATICSTRPRDDAPEVRPSSTGSAAPVRGPRDAPARHQRLPAQGRRHPVVPVGAVAAAARPTTSPCSPRRTTGAAAWDADAAVPGRAHRRAGAAAHAAAGAAHRRAGRRGRRRARVLDPALPVGLLGPAPRAGPTASCSTAPRSPCPAACPAPAALLRPGAARAPRWWSPPAATRLAEARAGGRARRCPSSSCRRASTPTASGRSTRPARRAAARPASACPATAAGRGQREPPRAPQGLRRAHRGRRRAWRRPAPTSRVAIAGGGPRPRPARAARRRRPARRSGSSAGCPTTTCPRSTAAPTCSPCCAATAGPASSRRASASCSSRRPPRGVPQVAGRQRRRRRGGGRRRDRPRRAPTRTTPTRWPPRWPGCSTTPSPRRGWARPAGAGPWPSSSYDVPRRAPARARWTRSEAGARGPAGTPAADPRRRHRRWHGRLHRRRGGVGAVALDRSRASSRAVSPSCCSSVGMRARSLVGLRGRGRAAAAPTHRHRRAVLPAPAPRPATGAGAGCWASLGRRRWSWPWRPRRSRPFTEPAFGVLAPMFGLGLMAACGAPGTARSPPAADPIRPPDRA